MEPLRREDSERRLVAVFRDDATARAAAEAVRTAGITGVTIDEHRDDVAAIRGEMGDEMRHTVIGPGNVGPFTKEMTKGFVPATALATLIGAVIALPLALIPLGDLEFGLRLLIAALVGAFAGATWGFVAGGAGRWEVEVEDKQLATEQGVTVGVWTSNETVEQIGEILQRHDPLRVDQVTPEGHALRTIATEEDNPA